MRKSISIQELNLFLGIHDEEVVDIWLDHADNALLNVEVVVVDANGVIKNHRGHSAHIVYQIAITK